MAASTVLLILSCTGPYYERAAILPGLSGGGGIGVTAGERPINSAADFPGVGRNISGLGTGFLRYGLSRNVELFGQLTAGYGLWNHASYNSLNTPGSLALSLTDFQLGGKFRIGRNGALRANIGLLDLADVAYLHDFGRHLTGVAGFGTRGVSLGVVNHVRLSPRVVQHISLTVTGIPYARARWNGGAFLGVGWQVLGQPRE